MEEYFGRFSVHIVHLIRYTNLLAYLLTL